MIRKIIASFILLLCLITSNITWANPPIKPTVITHTLNRNYENQNHLNNVLAVCSDKKIPVSANQNTVNTYKAEAISMTDYSPFGVTLAERGFTHTNYRYCAFGYEKDDQVRGSGNSYTTEFRMLDPRLGRWLSIDPIVHAMYSPYSAFDNNPVYYVDPSGADSENKNDLNVNQNKPGPYKIATANNTGGEESKLQEELNKVKKDLMGAKNSLVKAQLFEDATSKLTATGAVKNITNQIVKAFINATEDGSLSDKEMKEYLDNPEKFKVKIDQYVKDVAEYTARTGRLPETFNESERQEFLQAQFSVVKEITKSTAIIAAHINPYVRAYTTALEQGSLATVRVLENKVHNLNTRATELEKELTELRKESDNSDIEDSNFGGFGGGIFNGGGAGGDY